MQKTYGLNMLLTEGWWQSIGMFHKELHGLLFYGTVKRLCCGDMR